MIATLTMSPTTDFRNSNTAGNPLPLLPRRSSSANRTTFSSLSATSPKPTPPIRLVVQHAAPPDDTAEASSSSSSSSDGRPTVSIRVKRVRGVRPPEHSTPTPTPTLFPTLPSPPPPSPDIDATPRPTARPTRPLVYVPGASTGLRALSTSHLPPISPSPPKSAVDDTPRMVRKKSGQPVKSSLKSSTPRPRGSLAVVTGGAGSSKSAPSTPTQGTRSVHFDAQLEHVKLFIAEQKPLAVSRDGSPTDDTSGTDGDFPDWIYGGREGGAGAGGRLEMLVEVPPPPGELDVKLQALTLSEDGTSVGGTVAVRNMAFDKWVAVRFTFDDWQTTSEVTGRYSHSLPGGRVDVFAFTIRLNDLLARIEGKIMMLAVRYTSAGREMWDNNGGKNYRATFRRVRRELRGREQQEEKEEPKPTSTSKPKGPEGEVAADLRTRLERVVKGQEPGPLQLRSAATAKNAAETADKFKAGGSLAARYDFGTSSRNPWRPHQRAQSHPVFEHDSPSPPSTIPWPTVGKQAVAPPNKNKGKPLPLGSPRDAADDTAFRPAPYVASDNEDAPFAMPSPPTATTTTARNHQRGYFDVPLRDAAALRRTPPGTPRRALDDLTPLGSPGGRYNSFPPLALDGRLVVGLNVLELDARLTPRGAASLGGSVSEESTPGVLSGASSRSGSASPVSPPDLVGLGLAMPVGSPVTYHNFLDKFCFYTGPEASGVEGLPRTQSASSVEEFLSAATSATPRLHAYVQRQKQQQLQQSAPAHTPTPLRFDDSRSSDSRGSGSTTPTSASDPHSHSRAATPVAA
ncbi:putative phosphatase regulatory subunit-domain-containing protein [Mycena metata]|uniref:Phosphatase regulatory subunit-domain-containing protein n=1 Tax=Mycena metata TaxID=1033252 RepID=A0AAD7JT38_9AGAR|nr:putative phosphatase regulatory subunit-domain-containing protein [Mycena metata]